MTAPVSDPWQQQALEKVVAEFVTRHRCPSLAWGVIVDGRLVDSGGAGATTDGSVPDSRTIYRIASMTKSFSAAAVLILRADGVLSLDDPLERWAPELASVRSDPDAGPLRIRHLLTMTSGLVVDDPWADRRLDMTDAELDAIIADGPVFAQPTGSTFHYSNLGYALLGRVVRRATGRAIQSLVSERLLEPLGLDDTGWHQPTNDRWQPPMRPGPDPEGGFEPEIPTPGDGVMAPMGGLWSTVADLARWVGFMADAFAPPSPVWIDGPGPGCIDAFGAVMTRADRREMQSTQVAAGDGVVRGVESVSGYGYGLRTLIEAHPDGPVHVVSHSGGLPGYGSNMRWLTGGRIGVVALANATYAPVGALTAQLQDALVAQMGEAALTAARPAPGDRPGQPIPPTRGQELNQIGHRLVGLLNGWDDVVADDLFAENVVLDQPYERARADAAALVPLSVVDVEPIDRARARITATAEGDRTVTIEFHLAPAPPLRIQRYRVDPIR